MTRLRGFGIGVDVERSDVRAAREHPDAAGVFDLAEITRTAVVVHNHVLIKLFQIKHQLNTFCAATTAWINLSTSCRVLYIANEARAVAGMA